MSRQISPFGALFCEYSNSFMPTLMVTARAIFGNFAAFRLASFAFEFCLGERGGLSIHAPRFCTKRVDKGALLKVNFSMLLGPISRFWSPIFPESPLQLYCHGRSRCIPEPGCGWSGGAFMKGVVGLVWRHWERRREGSGTGFVGGSFVKRDQGRHKACLYGGDGGITTG